MRSCFFLILLFTSIISHSQTCDSLNVSFATLPLEFPQKANCIDSFGQKQGWWVYYNLYETQPEKINSKPRAKYYFYGQYLDNSKIGLWEYVSALDDMISIYKTELFDKDSSVTVTNYAERSITKYNSDSSHVISFMTIYPDTFCIECNRHYNTKVGNCLLKYKEHILLSFSFNDFSIIQSMVTMGLYNREVALIKSKLK